MDSLDETSITSKMGFFKYVFNFDDNSKAEMLNIIQYALIAIVPVVILNKSMQKFIPEANDQKGSLEIVAEVIGQVLSIFLGLFFIHRIITYIPTYSKEKYPSFSIIYIILAVLMITLSLQTKLGEKVSILFDRVADLWEGKMGGVEEKPAKKKKGVNNQGGQQQQQGGQQGGQTNQNQNNQLAINQALYSNTTSIDSLPTYSQQEGQGQQLPDYNSMYKKQNTPLVDAQSPTMEAMNGGIMAANEVLGGSFGSNF